MIDYALWTARLRILSYIFSIIAGLAMLGTYHAQQAIMDNIAYASCDGYAYDQDQAPDICR